LAQTFIRNKTFVKTFSVLPSRSLKNLI